MLHGNRRCGALATIGVPKIHDSCAEPLFFSLLCERMHLTALSSPRGVRRRSLLALGALGMAAPALAQFRVEISGVGMRQWPIAIAPFAGEAGAPHKPAAIIAADLQRTGRFRIVDAAGSALDETRRPEMAAWVQRGADSLAAGSAARRSDGRWDVRYRLWDVPGGKDLGGQSYTVTSGDVRLAAHRIADDIYEKLTGEKGAFATRLAYVTHAGGRYTLWVADADGENAQAALSSPESIISPAWSPSGAQLAYVSFEARKPVVYVHDVASGRRRMLANFRGSNSAPAWSPDGRTLALTLSLGGGSQIYLISASGGQPRRLTQSSSIDTEPVFSPDGGTLYFVSDRSGGPQIYRMPASGGAAQRVTFSGSYNVSPAISPDGRWLAYISRDGGYRLHVMDLSTGAVQAVTDTSNDENPSFAPNSRQIVYASGGALMTTTPDGAIKARLAGKGGVREPAWGPFSR